MKKKCIVLFSGGLDSHLVIKIMQKRGFEITALHFNLPFGCNFNFTQIKGVKLKILNCTKGKLLKKYLEILKKGKHGRGVGFNPCIDCKIFMFKKAKKYASKKRIKIIATGEVLGQRPMSQTSRAMKIIDKEINFDLIRPLIELGISGRNRKKQVELAKQFKIKYPFPAGGCLLCEKELKNKFKFLINENLINEKTLPFVNIGRHFIMDKSWIVLGKNEQENRIIEKRGKKFNLIIPNYSAPTAIILSKFSEKTKKKVESLIEAYSKKGNLNKRKKFDKYSLIK